MSQPFRLLLLLAVLASQATGCFLFRNSIRSQLLDIEMLPIPGGTFTMGDVFEEDNTDALPLHAVTLPPFLLSKYEVTYAQYDAFAIATERPLPEDDDYERGNRAVAHVSWFDAAAFCESYGYRLPTEQEWEYAARDAGKNHLYAGTSDADSLSLFARTKENSVGFSSLVGRKQPTSLGLYDMSGNVAEWVGDYYQFYPEPGTEPIFADLDQTGIRILRGGYFNQPEQQARTYWRMGTLGEVQTFGIGFRCAQSLD